MKIKDKWKWLSLLLTVFLLLSAAGCGKDPAGESSEQSGSADDPNTRYATLMGAKHFINTFKGRGKLTDRTEAQGSDGEDAPVSLLLRNVDGDANVFYYLDVTGEVDLEDLEKDNYIPDFQKRLNQNSDTYHYSKMERLDHGVNYCEFRVSIEDRAAEEALSSDEESASVQKNRESRPMIFYYVQKGKKLYEVIGLDMEAEDASSFSKSFQNILDEMVTVKEVSDEEDA